MSELDIPDEFVREFLKLNRIIVNKKRGSIYVQSRERAREIDRESYARHREERIAKTRRWKEDNPERAKENYRKNDRIRALDGRKRNYDLKNRYGLTAEDVKRMEDTQQGRCLICYQIPKTGLVVDHNHTTGQVRGLLCRACNSAIGKLREDPELFARAVNYLSQSLVLDTNKE